MWSSFLSVHVDYQRFGTVLMECFHERIRLWGASRFGVFLLTVFPQSRPAVSDAGDKLWVSVTGDYIGRLSVLFGVATWSCLGF